MDFRGRFAWRVTLLLILGYLHGLVYGGDILQVLAVAGFLILPFWQATNRVLLVAAARAWMRRYHYGPLEWLWRVLTLGDRSVPFVRGRTAAGPGTA